MDLSLDSFLLPSMRKLISYGYFRFAVDGLSNIPKDQPIVFVGNHSGWTILDAGITYLALHDYAQFNPLPKAVMLDLVHKLPMLHHASSIVPNISAAEFKRRIKHKVVSSESLIVAPEGSAGNTKPFWQAYRMRAWKTGFVRYAIINRAKVIPMCVMGAEESMPVLAQLNFFKPYIGTAIPVPFCCLPLPANLAIDFLEPIDMAKYPSSFAQDESQCEKITKEIQQYLQQVLSLKVQNRTLATISKIAEVLGF